MFRNTFIKSGIALHTFIAFVAGAWNGRARETRVSPSRASVLSCTHQFLARATQASLLEWLLFRQQYRRLETNL